MWCEVVGKHDPYQKVVDIPVYFVIVQCTPAQMNVYVVANTVQSSAVASLLGVGTFPSLVTDRLLCLTGAAGTWCLLDLLSYF